ncbi:hypothetical protein LIA77_07439 [Sarocladium implicatum]|nr:hypothetical protein LIA77_07439 [Sarocladium implicatum]
MPLKQSYKRPQALAQALVLLLSCAIWSTSEQPHPSLTRLATTQPFNQLMITCTWGDLSGRWLTITTGPQGPSTGAASTNPARCCRPLSRVNSSVEHGLRRTATRRSCEVVR